MNLRMALARPLSTAITCPRHGKGDKTTERKQTLTSHGEVPFLTEVTYREPNFTAIRLIEDENKSSIAHSTNRFGFRRILQDLHADNQWKPNIIARSIWRVP